MQQVPAIHLFVLQYVTILNDMQAQISFLAEEMSRKDILTQEVEILKEFSTQLQQEQQSSVQGGPCYAQFALTGGGWEMLLLLQSKTQERLKYGMFCNFVAHKL